MRTLLISFAVLTTLAGCSTMRSPALYGNFVQAPAPAVDKKMAADTILKLEMFYPPARTRINMLQATADPFGSVLIGSLRKRGYAINEFDARATSAGHSAAPGTQSGIAVAYVVDQPLDASMYRITVLIDRQSLSRLYLAKDGVVTPAGYWVHKE